MRLWRTSRFARVAGLEFATQVRRPMFLILLAIVLFATWGVATGHVTISSGDASVGGKRAWITSEFQNTLLFCYLTVLFYAFFIAVALGTTIVHDDDLRVGELLHTTGLRPRSYIWGKFTGGLAAFLLMLIVQLIVTYLCEHVVPIDDADKLRGPFALAHYLKPGIGFAIPTVVFLAGTSFWLGERTRRPILVFLFPVAILIVVAFLFWDWDPSWLDPRLNRVLGWLDPTGYRWLNETHIKVDRGVDYYNTQPVHWDRGFLLSRIAMVGLALGAVAWSERRFARRLRVAPGSSRKVVASPAAAVESHYEGLRGLAMQVTKRRIAAQAMTVAKFEFRNLASTPGLYLFVPLILLQTILTAVYSDSVWGTRLIVTSGGFAVGTLNTITLCAVLLLMFYTVESIDREFVTRLAPIYRSTPVHTLSILFGKALANCFVGGVIVVGAWLGAVITMLAQGEARPALAPFGIVWLGLLVPTLLLWTGFVSAVRSIVRNKYTTYAIALAVLTLTGVLQAQGKMTWVWNWNLWNAVRWSDMGLFEPNGRPLFWNRLLEISGAVFWFAVALRFSPRQELDSTRIVHRLAPARLWREMTPLLPYTIVPVGIAIGLMFAVHGSFQSKPARRAEHDYWKQNLATWRDTPRPGLANVDLEVSLDPAAGHFHTHGTYALVNNQENAVRQMALTIGRHVGKVKWTQNGSDYEPDNRACLYVFTPPLPIAPRDTLRIGFDFEGRWPDRITRNGGGMMEFLQPSGAVLTAFTPSFVPTVGWDETIGVDPKENRYEPRVYPTDYWKGVVPAGLGLARPFPTRIRVDAPAEYTLNANGTLVEEHVDAGRRFATWVSDQPVNFFNVVAGKWAVRKGDGTAIYYYPGHTYNIDEMAWTLAGARRWYSEWFAPYPWKELKLSEFGNLATYAQGFATNITFSEGIGFLTLSDVKTRAAFVVTAHESAHQWWGNMLVPGEGPGGDILSEGMAHFSTMLLSEQMFGPQGRFEFAKRIEERYDNARHVDAERPLVRIDGSKDGDQTVTYDKGGWVFWMLHDLMGREANLAGNRAFLANHRDNPDHPLLEDYIAELRPFAPDSTAFDAFTKQWFFEVVVPEYQFDRVEKKQAGKGWVVSGLLRNIGTGKMPVELAATRGERFQKVDAKAPLGPTLPGADYQEARTALVLGAGESAEFRLETDFEPTLVIADPDVRVLQLKRKNTLHRF